MTRGDVIKALEICGTNENCHSCHYYRCDDCLGSMMLDAKTIIVNSAPVKHGEWSTYDVSGYRKCSMCGGYVNWNPKPFMFGDGEYNYCPNCGADMRERKDDDSHPFADDVMMGGGKDDDNQRKDPIVL